MAQCRDHFDGFEKFKDPKTYFDDAIVHLRINKNADGEVTDTPLEI